VQVDSSHPDYDACATKWSRARDVLAGEDAVKAAGGKYLPKLDSQSEEEYAAYKARASFFGATARTVEEYLDLVFRKAPEMALAVAGGLKGFVSDCDRWGTEFLSYARRVVGEVLGVGRAGSLVLPDSGSTRPWVSLWRAEEILNWAVERIGGRTVLVGVVLKDGECLRVLRLFESVCLHEVWIQVNGTWSIEESTGLKRDGVALPFIPFVFHGPRNSRPDVDRLPLGDMIAANLDHFRLDADYKHGLHFAALPTAWVSGFDKAAPLRIGSSTAWVSEVPGASAGFLEFSAAGLGHIEKAMEKVERRMALLGARMLEGTGVPATGQAASVGCELCGLGSIVASLNQSLSHVLRMAQWWVDGGELELADGQVGFTMNTDLGARAMSGEEITAVVAAWRSGAISRETMLERLKRGEVLPDGRSVAQERALIHRTTGTAGGQ
jgi:hypothetical protein